MNVIKKMANAVNTKMTALGVTLMLPVAAMAAEPADVAVEKITALQTGVAAVGGAILGITLAVVGFFVIKRMANRT